MGSYRSCEFFQLHGLPHEVVHNLMHSTQMTIPRVPVCPNSSIGVTVDVNIMHRVRRSLVPAPSNIRDVPPDAPRVRSLLAYVCHTSGGAGWRCPVAHRTAATGACIPIGHVFAEHVGRRRCCTATVFRRRLVGSLVRARSRGGSHTGSGRTGGSCGSMHLAKH